MKMQHWYKSDEKEDTLLIKEDILGHCGNL